MKKILVVFILLFSTIPVAKAEEIVNYPIWGENEQIVGKTNGEADFYTIILQQDQRVTFTFQHIGDARLEIWTAPKSTVSISIKDIPGDSSSHFVDLRKGTYKISIRDAIFSKKELEYAISYKLSEVGGYDLEKNDSIEFANPIPLDTRIVGNLDTTFYYTDDYYRVDLSDRSIITLQIDKLFNSQVNANLVGFTLYDKDLQKIGSNRVSYQYDGSVKQYVDAGTYYVKVENLNANEPSIDYAFTVSAEPVDPNILTETGKNINEKNAMELPFNTLLYGFFYDESRFGNTFDYYKITVPKEGTIQIRLNRELVGSHLRLLGDNNFHVFIGNREENTPTILETSVKAGEYILEATTSFAFNGTSPYTLLVRMQSFTDVAFSHLYYEQIEKIKNRKIINGYPDETFRPTNAIKREHVFKMLAAVDEIDFSKVRTVKEFSDVSETNPYYEQIKLMYESGIVDGDQGKMNPTSTLTRAQLAKILVNAFDLKMNGDVKGYTDVSPSDWSYKYIQILESNGIAKGSNGMFLPNDPVSRQHFTVFLARILESN